MDILDIFDIDSNDKSANLIHSDYPALDQVPIQYLDSILALLDPTQIAIAKAAKYIESDLFWKRLSQQRWKICEINKHGASWKR